MFGQLFMFFTVLSASETSAIEPGMSCCYTFDGRDYRGTLARTLSGKTCQSWVAQTPHSHDDYKPDIHPHAGLDQNYCRNPSKNKMPWCYTTDSETRWEFCPVPRCDYESHQKVLKLKVSPGDPTVDLDDPAVMEDILKQVKEKLHEVCRAVKLTWKKQPDRNVFQKEEADMTK